MRKRKYGNSSTLNNQDGNRLPHEAPTPERLARGDLQAAGDGLERRYSKASAIDELEKRGALTEAEAAVGRRFAVAWALSQIGIVGAGSTEPRVDRVGYRDTDGAAIDRAERGKLARDMLAALRRDGLRIIAQVAIGEGGTLASLTGAKRGDRQRMEKAIVVCCQVWRLAGF